MDILGRSGEKAREDIETVSRRIESLESHLNAVDSALSDLMDNYEKVIEQEQEIDRRELGKIEEAREDIETEKKHSRQLRERIEELETRQARIESRLEELVSSDLLKTVSSMRDEIRRLRTRFSELKDLEEKVNEIENELVLEVNSRDFDFEKKLDRREFKDRETELYEEIRKLRTSVNVLAEELDSKDEIEID